MSALRSDLLIAPQEIYTSSTTPNTDIGARATTGDGRVFRYCSVGSTTALAVGKVYQSAAQDTNNFQALGVSATAGTGTFTVTTGSTITLASNQLAGGLLSVGTSTGAGYVYRIKSHPAVSAGTVTFTLEDPIQVAIATTAQIDVTPNAYGSLIIAATTVTGMPVGVAVFPIPANNFGWIQTRGLATVYCSNAVTVGNGAVPSSATAGGLMNIGAAGSLPIVATAAITTAATGKYAPFFLQFE